VASIQQACAWTGRVHECLCVIQNLGFASLTRESGSQSRVLCLQVSDVQILVCLLALRSIRHSFLCILSKTISVKCLCASFGARESKLLVRSHWLKWLFLVISRPCIVSKIVSYSLNVIPDFLSGIHGLDIPGVWKVIKSFLHDRLLQ
jgi:hypothetical protein